MCTTPGWCDPTDCVALTFHTTADFPSFLLSSSYTVRQRSLWLRGLKGLKEKTGPQVRVPLTHYNTQPLCQSGSKRPMTAAVLHGRPSAVRHHLIVSLGLELSSIPCAGLYDFRRTTDEVSISSMTGVALCVKSWRRYD